MAHNRYFIINADDNNLNDIISVSVGELKTQRYSLDNTQIVIKLYENDHNNYPFLSQYTEYNHHDILEVMQTDKWTQNIEQDA
jgi:hypothetical protein